MEELESIGLIPVINTDKVKNAEKLEKALSAGGLKIIENAEGCNYQKLVIPDELLIAEDYSGIIRLCREAVDKMLGFTLVHVGINCANPEEAEAVADEFDTAFGFTKKVGNSSVFAASYVEMMKKPFRGTYGHIAIATTSVKSAVYHLALRGFEADESSFKYNAEGVLNVAYLKKEFGGFAVHLVLKK